MMAGGTEPLVFVSGFGRYNKGSLFEQPSSVQMRTKKLTNRRLIDSQ
jgi:hypothetical protein